jgi:hypothetical protein
MRNCVVVHSLLIAATFHWSLADSQHRLPSREQWANRAVSEIKSSRQSLNESVQTRRQSAQADCNITKECHICPDDAIRDGAEYCVLTGWRQVYSIVHVRITIAFNGGCC